MSKFDSLKDPAESPDDVRVNFGRSIDPTANLTVEAIHLQAFSIRFPEHKNLAILQDMSFQSFLRVWKRGTKAHFIHERLFVVSTEDEDVLREATLQREDKQDNLHKLNNHYRM